MSEENTTEKHPAEGLTEAGFEFNLALTTMPVTLTDKDGKKLKWELRELVGKERDQYLNMVGDRTKVHPDSGKPIGFKKFDGMQAKVLGMSLWHIKEERFATSEEIDNWPNRILDPMCDWVLKTSKLMPEEEDKKGNDDGES